MFYSDNLFPVLLLMMFLGLALLVLGKPESHFSEQRLDLLNLYSALLPVALTAPPPQQLLAPDPSSPMRIVVLILPPRLPYFLPFYELFLLIPPTSSSSLFDPFPDSHSSFPMSQLSVKKIKILTICFFFVHYYLFQGTKIMFKNFFLGAEG